MRRGLPAAAAALLIGFAALPALPGPFRANVASSTKAFSIDGKRFLADGSAEDDLSAIRRELKKQGVDVRFDATPRPLDPRFHGIVREDGDAGRIPPLPLPRGLSAEHIMRMETASGPIDVAFGTSRVPSRAALDQLRSSGWECVQAGPGGDRTFVASRNKGRETFIVLLEEKERGFLFLRQVAE